jgi:hypothetical protein
VARGEEPCAPAAGGPAFGVAVSPSGRRSLKVGETLQLQVTGWASAAVDDWRIEVTPWAGDFAIQASLDVATLNAGRAAQLSVSVPFPVPDGSRGAVLLRAVGTGETPLWPVSITVTR